MQALKISKWKANLGLAGQGPNILSSCEEGLKTSSWINQANCGTQLAATSGALILALGLEDYFLIPELRNILPQNLLERINLDEIEGLKLGKIKMPELMEAIEKKGYGKIIRKNVQRALPLVANAIQQKRLALPGLMCVGTKVESPKSMNPHDVEFALELAGLGDARTTPFTLKHNHKSLVLPPLPTAFEEKLLIYFFVLLGAVEAGNVDLQITTGCRVSNNVAAVMGASNILASMASVRYAPGAFGTDRFLDAQESRIFCYDAGVRNSKLPFDLQDAEGRTDKVGAKSLFDIDQIQLLGTYGSHWQCEGPFEKQFNTYEHNFHALLKEHGLLHSLFYSRWVYEPALTRLGAIDPIEFHEEMVGRFCHARADNPRLKESVRRLMVRDLLKPLRDNRDQMIEERKEEYAKLANY